MTKHRVRRLIAGLTAMSVAALGLEMATGVVPVAADNSGSITLSCVGREDDSSGALGSSKKALDAIALLNPGGGAGLSFNVDVHVTAPSKVRAGSAPFPVGITYTLKLPESVVKPAKELLKLSQVTVPTATFSADATGGATAHFENSVSNLVVDLNAPVVAISQSMSGTVNPTGSGLIKYLPGNAYMEIKLGVTSPINIDTLRVNCTSPNILGTTSIQLPGAPNVDPVVIQQGGAGFTLLKTDLMSHITPDSGNPILPDSLKVTKGTGAGIGVLKDGSLYFIAPPAGGSFTADLEICGASRLNPAIPGVNMKQTLTIPNYPSGLPLNAHGVGIKLNYQGVATDVIQLSYRDWNILDLGNPYVTMGSRVPTPFDVENASALDKFSSYYVAPTPAQVQAVLERHPAIGAGNVRVTAGAASTTGTNYDIEFVNALGNKVLPGFSVAEFSSWLPSKILGAVTALLSPAPTPGPTTTTAPIETVEALNAKLFSGQITFDQWGAGISARLSYDLKNGIDPAAALDAVKPLFPAAPSLAETQTGDPGVPESQTGPLCSPFSVEYKLDATQVRAETLSNFKLCYYNKKVKVRTRVKGKIRTVTRTVRTANWCCPKTTVKRVPVRVNGRTRYVSQRVTTEVACSLVGWKS